MPDKAIEEVAAVLLGKLAAGHNCCCVKAAAQRVAAVTLSYRPRHCPIKPVQAIILGKTNRIKRLSLLLDWPQRREYAGNE